MKKKSVCFFFLRKRTLFSQIRELESELANKRAPSLTAVQREMTPQEKVQALENEHQVAVVDFSSETN
jgi:hypothetical protein